VILELDDQGDLEVVISDGLVCHRDDPLLSASPSMRQTLPRDLAVLV
jgi:hypothetical protein